METIPLEIESEKKEGEAWIYYDGDRYGPISAQTSPEAVKRSLERICPDAANAKVTQDEVTKDFTVTRAAGEKN